MRHEETKCDVREEGWERDVTDTGGKDRNKDISVNALNMTKICLNYLIFSYQGMGIC
jgi:hypothetical protein